MSIVILGVSPDAVDVLSKFRAKYELPFRLLSDSEHTLAETFGIWKRKKMFGHSYWGVERTTFVIDPEGTVRRVFERVNPVGHAVEVADAVRELATP
jgi:thioredoxin-dependent peroxiredoxin